VNSEKKIKDKSKKTKGKNTEQKALSVEHREGSTEISPMPCALSSELFEMD
jgi:hypothetical protein